MKLFPLLFFSVVITTSVCAQGVTRYGQNTTISGNFVNKNGKIGSVAQLTKNGNILFSCGMSRTIIHTIGTLAPETVTINYGTVTSNLSGADKCWITQNLGASAQATSATDVSDAAAGWYWQFNRKRGYKPGPYPVWETTSIIESGGWLAQDDPCTLTLGAGWRIPTASELFMLIDPGWGGVANLTIGYASVLKLHGGGSLDYNGGVLYRDGSQGNFGSSTAYDSSAGFFIAIRTSNNQAAYSNKASGLSLRCLSD